MIGFTGMLFFQKQAAAQYPVIPKSVEDSEAAVMARYQKLSDQAWAKALPVVEGERKPANPTGPGPQNRPTF